MARARKPTAVACREAANLRRTPTSEAWLAAKRILDFTGALIGIILTGPVMLATSIAIRITDPGPVLFRQVRAGRNGRKFTMLKFRSMVMDAEKRKDELMHLNRECRFPDLSNLFARQDCTEEIRGLLPDIPRQLRTLKRVLGGPLPEVEPGDHCTDPYECPFMDRCWSEPRRHAIETLYRLGRARREAFERRGYRTLLDLPVDEELTPIQERQRGAARKNGMVVDRGRAG